MTDFHSLNDLSRNVKADLWPTMFGHPDDVLNDATLTTNEKRALLASWASDANAVPHVPAARQLPCGSIVKVDDILRALKALDAPCPAAPTRTTPPRPWQLLFTRRRGTDARKWVRNRQGPDDDDDPPPCPAYAVVKPKGGGGATFADPEHLVLA
jgi:hypothetical protein